METQRQFQVCFRSCFSQPTLMHTSRECSITPVDTSATRPNFIHVPAKSPSSVHRHCGPRRTHTTCTRTSELRREYPAGSSSSPGAIWARYSRVRVRRVWCRKWWWRWRWCEFMEGKQGGRIGTPKSVLQVPDPRNPPSGCHKFCFPILHQAIKGKVQNLYGSPQIGAEMNALIRVNGVWTTHLLQTLPVVAPDGWCWRPRFVVFNNGCDSSVQFKSQHLLTLILNVNSLSVTLRISILLCNEIAQVWFFLLVLWSCFLNSLLTATVK